MNIPEDEDEDENEGEDDGKSKGEDEEENQGPIDSPHEKGSDEDDSDEDDSEDEEEGENTDLGPNQLDFLEEPLDSSSLALEKQANLIQMDDEEFAATFVNRDALRDMVQPLNTDLAIRAFKSLFQLSNHTMGVLANPENHRTIELWAAQKADIDGQVKSPMVVVASGSRQNKRKETGKTGYSPQKKKTKRDVGGKGKERAVDSDVSMEDSEES
jgi:hypothetical protein